MVLALSKVLPVFLLILLGMLLRKRQFVRGETVQDLKKLVVNVTLPAVLFMAFSQVTLDLQYLAVVILMFTACMAVWLGARFLRAPLGVFSPFFPRLMTGFEAGMMGYAIFAAVYGQDQIYKFGIVDLGQVLFVFFVLVPGLQRTASGARPFRETVIGFLKTPVILAILGGLLFKQSGLSSVFASRPLLNSVLATLTLVGSMTTPLVAIAIGYELQLKTGALRNPLRTVAARLLIWVPFGLVMSFLVMGRWLGLDPVFQAAVLTMVILPPPFVIPLFMRSADVEDTNYVLNTLTLATIITLFAFTLVPLVVPPG